MPASQPAARRQRFQLGSSIFSDIPAFPTFRLFRRPSKSIRHCGASRHLRAAICPLIPAQAGIHARRFAPSFRRKPESTRCDFPSFRRKPESTRCDFPVIPAQAGIYALRFSCHSGASRNLRVAIFPSFQRKPESTRCAFPRHSGASRNLPNPSTPPLPVKSGQNSAAIAIDKHRFRPLY